MNIIPVINGRCRDLWPGFGFPNISENISLAISTTHDYVIFLLLPLWYILGQTLLVLAASSSAVMGFDL